MDIAATISEINSLPVDDRLRIVDAIWEGISVKPVEAGLSEAQREEIDRRIAALDANPDDVISRKELRERLQRRRQT